MNNFLKRFKNMTINRYNQIKEDNDSLNHKDTDKRFYYSIIMSLLIFMTTVFIMPNCAYAACTHNSPITKYDNNYHWSECSVCGEILSTKTAHSLTWAWTLGASCSNKNIYRGTCSCGYYRDNTSQTNPVSHTWSEWKTYLPGGYHYRSCTVCSYQTDNTRCTNSSGQNLGRCNERTGTCTVCSANYQTKYHNKTGLVISGTATNDTTVTGSITDTNQLKCTYCDWVLVNSVEGTLDFSNFIIGRTSTSSLEASNFTLSTASSSLIKMTMVYKLPNGVTSITPSAGAGAGSANNLEVTSCTRKNGETSTTTITLISYIKVKKVYWTDNLTVVCGFNSIMQSDSTSRLYFRVNMKVVLDRKAPTISVSLQNKKIVLTMADNLSGVSSWSAAGSSTNTQWTNSNNNVAFETVQLNPSNYIGAYSFQARDQAGNVSPTVTFTVYTKPSLSGTYTYNGNAQTVTKNNFNSTYMNVTNDKKTNAGTYTCTFSLKSTANQSWNDGTTDSFTKQWTIEKANNPITVTNATMYTGTVLALSTKVSNNQGALSYEITSNGTTTASTLSGGNLTAGAMSTANDNNQSVVVKVTAAGNDNYNSASKNLTITVQKYTNGLTWTNTTPDTVTYGDTSKKATVTPATNGGTNGAITYSSGTPAVITINSSSGALNVVKGTGSSVITASMARTSTVKAATVTKTITAGKANNPITVTNATMYTGAVLALSTKVSNNQGALSYEITSNGTTTASTLSGGNLTAGAMSTANDNNQSVVVKVTAAGNDNYNSASKDLTITVQKYTNGLTWTNTTPDTVTYGDASKKATVTPARNGGTNGAITYSSGTPAVITINSSSGALTVVKGTGSSVITASMARTSTVKAATVTKTITAGKAEGFVVLSQDTLTVIEGVNETTFRIISDHGGDLSLELINAPSGITTSINGKVIDIVGTDALLEGASFTARVTSNATDNYTQASSDLVITVGLMPICQIDIKDPLISIDARKGTNNDNATLLISAQARPGTIVEMALANENARDNINWMPYETEKSWTLSNGDGYKTVYLMVKDNSGNVSVSFTN